MSSATRITGSSRRGSSATAMPSSIPALPHHHSLQHRPGQSGTSWPAASPSCNFAASSPHKPIGLQSTVPAAASPPLRSSIIAQCAGSRASACHPTFSGSSATTATHVASCDPAAEARRSAGSALAPHSAHGETSVSAASSTSSSSCTSMPSGSQQRWSVPSRHRVRASAVAISPPAPAPAPALGGGGGGGPSVATRPPSPSHGIPTSYFDGFCPEGASECSPVWEQLRWCSNWQQMRQLYDNLVRVEATALATTTAAAALAAAGGGGGGASASASSTSVDITAAAVAAASASSSGRGPATTSPSSSSSSASSPPSSSSSAPGLLTRDETYAFLLQLQDFYHLRLDEQELDELQAFRCRLVRDLSAYVRRLNAEQLEALCCASAVSGKCLTKERADAVQERLLKILASTSASGTSGTGQLHGHGHASHASTAASSAAAEDDVQRRRAVAAGGFQVLTPALNIIFALYDHGYLPQVALLQAVFRQAVDHCCEVTRSQWHGLHGLARRFRFLLDDHWLDDLHAYLRDPMSCTTDFGRMASILGCISAFTVNKAMEALDTRVLVVVEAIERRYDEGRSLLTAHQLCVFTALLVDMQSPFRTKWLGHCLDHLGSCRSHLAGLDPATLVLAVELVLRGRGWDEQRLLGKLFRQLFSTYAKHPTSALRGTSNVSGCPPRAASRIITAYSSTSSFPHVGHTAAPSLSAMAAAAAWDVEVGGAGGAASPPLDLVSLVDWLAAKVPAEPGPERTDTREFLQPLVSGLVEGGRKHLASMEPRRIPSLIKAVAMLGYSPSREWVAEAFTRVAGGADTLSGSELVAMLRVSHMQRLPLPHATLDAVCAHNARILPLMRAVDLQRLLECWVADRYVPSKEQLEGYFDAVCDVFGIDHKALKTAAASAGPSSASSPSTSGSYDSEDSAVPSAGQAGTGADAAAGGGDRPVPKSGSRNASFLDIELLQTAGGGVSAGAADGVAGSMVTPLRSRAAKVRSAAASGSGSGSGVSDKQEQAAAGMATSGDVASPHALPAAGLTAASSSSTVSAAAAAATAAAAAAIAADAAAAAAASADGKFKVPSLGSLDSRPKGSLLQPKESECMLALLDQYRSLLLEAKRSDLLIVMNTYRTAITAALHDMTKASGGAKSQQSSSRLLQAVLRGGSRGGSGGSLLL